MTSAVIDAARGALGGLDVLTMRRWADPLLDPIGHDPRSAYVEVFWTPTIGCTALVVARRLADALEACPDGLETDVATFATSLGLGFGPTGLLPKAMSRLVGFGHARLAPAAGEFHLRGAWPDLSAHQLARLPAYLQAAHRPTR